jgi:hypothetical protein
MTFDGDVVCCILFRIQDIPMTVSHNLNFDMAW